MINKAIMYTTLLISNSIFYKGVPVPTTGPRARQITTIFTSEFVINEIGDWRTHSTELTFPQICETIPLYTCI